MFTGFERGVIARAFVRGIEGEAATELASVGVTRARLNNPPVQFPLGLEAPGVFGRV